VTFLEKDPEVSTILKVSGAVVLSFVGLAFVLRLGGMGACGVADRTLDADNIIFNYEQFYDVSEKFKAKTHDLDTHKDLVSIAKEEGDKVELGRLRMELAALKSSCRSLASEYNADSQKLNRSIFKSNDLPHTLTLSDCE
jgi:hypothetical protein